MNNVVHKPQVTAPQAQAPETETVYEGLIKQSNQLVELVASTKANTKKKGELRLTLTKTLIKIMLADIKISPEDYKKYRSQFSTGEPLHSIRDILTHSQCVIENLGEVIDGQVLTAKNFEAFNPQKVYKFVVNKTKNKALKWGFIQDNLEGYAFMSQNVAEKNLGEEGIDALFAQAKLAAQTKATEVEKLRAELAELKAMRHAS